MSTDAGAVLTTVIGVLLTRLAVQGTFKQYVKPAMGPWLAVAGVLLAVLGLVVLWRHRRGDGDHADHGDGEHGDRADADASHGHHHGGERVAWLLLAPVVAILLIAPPSLGAFALGRTGSAVTVRSGPGTFAVLDPATAPHEMSLLEFDQRAFEAKGDGSSFAGAPVRLVGFVGPTKDDGFIVARFQIACCAADALAATAYVVGWDGPPPPRDSWVAVEGIFQPGDDTNPRLVATSVTPVPPPDDPYE